MKRGIVYVCKSENKPKPDEKLKDPARNKIAFQSGLFPYSSQVKNSSENLNFNAKLAMVKQPPRNPATIAKKTYGVPKKKKLGALVINSTSYDICEVEN